MPQDLRFLLLCCDFMAYDIPDKVKYKEKIILGLDLMQIIYACFFAGLAIASTRLPVAEEFRYVLPTFFVLVGLGFMFFDLESKLREKFSYIKSLYMQRHDKLFTNRITKLDRIEKKSYVLDSGALRAVLKISPLNFVLFDKDRKNSLIHNYREFLNHLDFPVQITVRTKTIDLSEYYNSFEKKGKGLKNPKLKELYNDFKEFETEYLKSNDVKERGYYLIISLNPKLKDKNRKFELLDERVCIAQEKLSDCAIESRRLDNDELRDFILSYLMGDMQVS